jgi:hypothetical protein
MQCKERTSSSCSGEKENDYLKKLDSILRDVRYGSSAADSYRVEQN